MEHHSSRNRLFDHVETILRATVDAATKGHNAAKHNFWRVCAEQSHGEQQTVREAAAATYQNLAREELIAAIRRLNNFTLDGTIPEELKYLAALGERAMGASR
jgi:hypothetical protein